MLVNVAVLELIQPQFNLLFNLGDFSSIYENEFTLSEISVQKKDLLSK